MLDVARWTGMALAALVSCASGGTDVQPPPRVAAAAGASAQVAAPAPTAPPSRGRTLSLADARRYMVRLINRDRASMGLAPVAFDDGAPTRGGQAHAEDMARNAYLGHWGSDGSVPEQRYTDAGGSDMVLENASCFTDGRARALDPAAQVDVQAIEQTEDMFFHEKPPHDGHRKNILKPFHKRVGIGVAQPVATATEIPVPCFTQEFVDAYGTYAPVPRGLRVGATLHVEGEVQAPATFGGVGLARVDAPRPLPVDELNRRRTYAVPPPYQMYWPRGYETPIVVNVAGNHFAVDLPVSDHGKPGMYEVSVWATVPGSPDMAMISLRTLQVR